MRDEGSPQPRTPDAGGSPDLAREDDASAASACHDLPFYEEAPRLNPINAPSAVWAKETTVEWTGQVNTYNNPANWLAAVHYLAVAEVAVPPQSPDLGKPTGRTARVTLYSNLLRNGQMRLFMTVQDPTGEVRRATWTARHTTVSNREGIDIQLVCSDGRPLPFLEATAEGYADLGPQVLRIGFYGRDNKWHLLTFHKREVIMENLPPDFFQRFSR